MILLDKPSKDIEKIIEQGLHISSEINIIYEMGLVYNLLSISTNNTMLINQNISKYPECMDFPYYFLINNVNKVIYSLSENIEKNINYLINLESPISFINSNSDHFLLLWFDIYIMLGNYEQAFSMLSKIKSLEYKSEGIEKLKKIKNTINLYLDNNALGE